MADDILTRNAAGELEVRTVATTGDAGTNKDDVYTRDAQGRLAVRVSGAGGGGGGASSASDLAVSPAGLSIITSMNAQGAFQELDSATKDLQDSASILTTSVELSTEIGGTTVVMLDELVAMDIDGRPSYKQAGATVYAENGVVGIIDTVDTDNQTADIKTVQFAGGQSVAGSDNGIKGDYCTTYGITDMPNGVITTPAENNNLIIPAGIVLKAAGAETLTTLASETTHETTSTDDFTLFYAGGEMLECGDVYYSETEPTANGVNNYQAWFSPIVGKWQFRSNDTGNVWREAIATPLCDCKFTDGNITRIDFVGYRVLNKQTFGGGAGGDYLPLSGGTLSGPVGVNIGDINDYDYKTHPLFLLSWMFNDDFSSFNYTDVGFFAGANGLVLGKRGATTPLLEFAVNDDIIRPGKNYIPDLVSGIDIGSSYNRFRSIAVGRIIAGINETTYEDNLIEIPNKAGTMAIAEEVLPLSGGTMTGAIDFDKGLTQGTTRQWYKLYGVVGNVESDIGNASSHLQIEYSQSWQGREYIKIYQTSSPNYGLEFNTAAETLTLAPVLHSSVAVGVNYKLGNKGQWWDIIYTDRIHAGVAAGDSADYTIKVPKQAGTMVVATPPTDNGTYVLKATVVDGVVTTEWVLES